MKIMYVAARYHTNQVPIVEGWIKNKDEVIFITQHSEFGREDHSALEPLLLGYSPLFKIILKLVWLMFGNHLKKAKTPNYFQAQFGFPPIIRLRRIMKNENPDMVILRDRCIYTTVVYLMCKNKNIPAILYNQTPYWEESGNIKTDLLHKIIRKLSPRIRITPVYGNKNSKNLISNGSYYVPFVINPMYACDEKEHFADNYINLVCVGKYEKRKNHRELIRIIGEILKNTRIRLTIIGECSREIHKIYYKELEELIAEQNISQFVILLKNLSLLEVYEEYRKADLFVLPSTGEFASISQLEAMACSLPVICSDTNGTAQCIKSGENGYLFEDSNFEDLKKKIEQSIYSRDNLIKMGEASFQIVKEEYNFENYRHKVESILNQM